jgi:hypothetical protein
MEHKLVNDLEKPLEGTINVLAVPCMGMNPQRQAVIKLDAEADGRHRYAVMNRADVLSPNPLPELRKGQRLRVVQAQKSGAGFLVIAVELL